VFNLIHQGTTPNFQEQIGLPLVLGAVEIGEESRYYGGFGMNISEEAA
jgi:hypothetical protein